MQRRKFIQLGTIITASTLISFKINNVLDTDENNKSKRDDFNNFKEPILKAIAIGLNAPSAHNTQSWKFKIVNNKEALLYVDENKLLLATDPLARQIHISAGCFLEALSIGCSAIGHEPSIEFLVDDKYTFESIGKMPIASIKLKENNKVTKHKLFDSIFERSMNRTNYNGKLINNEEFETLKKDCVIENSSLVFVNDPNMMRQFGQIFKDAMRIESKTLATNEETRKMFRFNDDEAKKHRDGITFDGNGLTGIKKVFAQAFTKNTFENWNSPNIVEKGLDKFNKSVDSSKGFIMIISEQNDFESQIQVGRDLYQYCLALTKNGFYMHPLNQANEEFKEMDELRKSLDKLAGISNNQKIQIIARIGRAEKPYKSYRKHLKDFIITS